MFIIASILQIFSLILVVRAALTWFPQVDRNNEIVRFIFQVTEPILEPVRRILPPINGMDFSVLAVLVMISVVTNILWRL